jgi:maleylpyruvate isomerase
MPRPDPWLTGVSRSHRTLADQLRGLTDSQARQPSRLDGWSVGHLVTHLARNADGHRNMAEHAARGEIGDQYPGGSEQRNGDIEAGSLRAASELVEDVAAACAALEAAWSTLTDEGWSVLGRTRTGEHTQEDHVFRRWREVEIHLVDLGLGYEPADWPDDYLEEELRRGLEHLPNRAGHRELLAWMLGRGPLPDLGPWG